MQITIFPPQVTKPKKRNELECADLELMDRKFMPLTESEVKEVKEIINQIGFNTSCESKKPQSKTFYSFVNHHVHKFILEVVNGEITLYLIDDERGVFTAIKNKYISKITITGNKGRWVSNRFTKIEMWEFLNINEYFVEHTSPKEIIEVKKIQRRYRKRIIYLLDQYLKKRGETRFDFFCSVVLFQESNNIFRILINKLKSKFSPFKTEEIEDYTYIIKAISQNLYRNSFKFIIDFLDNRKEVDFEAEVDFKDLLELLKKNHDIQEKINLISRLGKCNEIEALKFFISHSALVNIENTIK